MSESPQLVTLEPTTVAVVRETVPMEDLTEFFDRVFHAVMAASEAQGVPIAGPPFAIYHGMPGETVDVAAGFPTAGIVSPDGGVMASELPGGRAVQLLHVGTYDELGEAYGRIAEWVDVQGLIPAPFMWETYLTEPSEDHPEESRTLVTWPVE